MGFTDTARIASAFLAGRVDLDESRIAFFIKPSQDFIDVLHGVWRAGGIAMPLPLSYPAPELEYLIRDAGAEVIVADPDAVDRLSPIAAVVGAVVVTVADLIAHDARPLPDVSADRRALILYTSGTTGRPKGVVTTHANVAAQIASLVTAWEWTSRDRTLLVLPLHHVHGLINVVSCAFSVGAACEMHEKFDADATWARLASGEITVFTAVPTIYHRLIASWDAAPPDVQSARSAGCRAMRLMMSGSAALPVSTLERWRQISGHTLLERYGMTELGMALSNPLHGERRPGKVGTPLPGVQVRIVDDEGQRVEDGVVGELEVRGPTVFLEYWRQPDATRDACRDGWFRTGDVGVVEEGSYRLLGRTSVDIIKTGGHKISALEIEEVLRRHDAIADCAVVGVPDAEWGERVCVAIEVRPDASVALEPLQEWARAFLAPFKVPRRLCCVTALPRNAMGKVVKPDVAALFDD